MSRTVPSSLLTALGQPEVEPFFAVEFILDTNPVRLWTGFGNKTIGVNTYNGAGGILGISGFEEVADLSAKSIDISLVGLDSALLAQALIDTGNNYKNYQRRPCNVYFGARNISDPVLIFSGLINVMNIEDSGETSTISVKVDSKLIMLERTNTLRYNEAGHQSYLEKIGQTNSDSFFSFVADIADKKLVWGKESS